jgi:hypothetical protein
LPNGTDLWLIEPGLAFSLTYGPPICDYVCTSRTQARLLAISVPSFLNFIEVRQNMGGGVPIAAERGFIIEKNVSSNEYQIF